VSVFDYKVRASVPFAPLYHKGQISDHVLFFSYKKTGEPFINLVTLIPLFIEGTSIIEYYVGFQVRTCFFLKLFLLH
jgi:hypothetical protein